MHNVKGLKGLKSCGALRNPLIREADQGKTGAMESGGSDVPEWWSIRVRGESDDA